jgi:glutamine amidotransferase
MMRVCILDYGSGNVRSVYNQVLTRTETAVISNSAEAIRDATHLILPGVGAFGEAMKCIRRLLPLDVVADEVLKKGKPFLGICVGMQVLATTGSELGEHRGLGWIPGTVVQIASRGLRIPHVGWNDLVRSAPHPLFADIPRDVDFYFVHSYVMCPDDNDDVLASTVYGEEFCSVVGHKNIFGVQFHPEKSQAPGGKLIENFLNFT